MTNDDLSKLRLHVVRLRAAIDRLQKKSVDVVTHPFINHWPMNCCDAPYLFLMLYDLSYRGMSRMRGDVAHFGEEFDKHVWLVLDDVTIDISADQFPGVTEKAIVTFISPWHEALGAIEEEPWALDSEDALYNRYCTWQGYSAYQELLKVMSET